MRAALPGSFSPPETGAQGSGTSPQHCYYSLAEASHHTVHLSRDTGSDQRPGVLRDRRADWRGREKGQQQAPLHQLPAQTGKRTWTARLKTKTGETT